VSPDRQSLHPQALALLEREQAVGAAPVEERGAVAARADAKAEAVANGSGPSVAQVRELTIPATGGELRVRLYEPHGALGTVVWFHGGGWVLDGLELTDAMCRMLANESGASVVNVDYRVAPEHRFPAALEDCFDTLRWVAAQADRGPIALGGDSAGGNLAAVCAVRARDAAIPIVAQVLVYPVTGSDLTTPSYVLYGEPELPMLTTASMAWFFDCYARGPADLSNPELAPLHTRDLSALAPAIVVVAEHDPLRDDALLYAERLEDAGVEVTLLHHHDMPHGFFARPTVLDTGAEAIARVGAQLRDAIAAAG